MDVRPIIGVEILTDRLRAILPAEDRRGYGNLCRITTARNLAAGFDLAEQLKVDNRGVLCICSQPTLAEELKILWLENEDIEVAKLLARIRQRRFDV